MCTDRFYVCIQMFSKEMSHVHNMVYSVLMKHTNTPKLLINGITTTLKIRAKLLMTVHK